MIINLKEIYAGLKEWRDERHISVERQKSGYIVNAMVELGELAQALRNYEKLKECLDWAHNEAKCGYQAHKYSIAVADAEHEIIDALCNISIFTINAGADLSDKRMPLSLDVSNAIGDLYYLLFNISKFDFPKILFNCAAICKDYGYNFEVAMLETIKEISSRTGSYDDTKAGCYKADYERAKTEDCHESLIDLLDDEKLANRQKATKLTKKK